MQEYKVITEKDSLLLGKADGKAIERMLNEHAAEGWRMVNSFNVASMKTFGSQMVFILERSAS